MKNLSNPEYERALLGAILLDNRVLEEHPISAALFSSDFCLEVFRWIEKTIARGAVANIMEIGLMMPQDAAEVANLTDIGTTANSGFHFKQLSETARKRGIAKLARDMGEMAYDENLDADALFAYCDKALLEVSDIRGIGYMPMIDFMRATTKEIGKAIESKGALLGVPTGFSKLDDKTNGWQRQNLIVIGARPGAGKTSIALNMASAALRADVPVGFFSAEMSGPAIIKRMIADWAQVEYKRVQSGLMGTRDIEAITEACERLAVQHLFINDAAGIGLAGLVSDARKMRRRENIGILFIDYLSLISNQQKNVPRHEQVAEISRSLKGLARELDIPVVVLSQLTREAQGERPKLSQLRDSGAVEQDADMVILLFNRGFVDETKSQVKIDLIVEKNRNGATGDISMLFRPGVMRFAELDGTWGPVKASRGGEH
jgi:replicative DNA helicase